MEHWAAQQRPISAETLRRELKIGAHRARTLVSQIRNEHARGRKITSTTMKGPSAPQTSSGALSPVASSLVGKAL